MTTTFFKTFAAAALLTTTAFAQTATVDPVKTNSFGGFFLGAHTGGISTTVQDKRKDSAVKKTDFAKTHAIFGLNGGYLAMLNQCFGLGIDVNFEYGKSDITLHDGGVETSVKGYLPAVGATGNGLIAPADGVPPAGAAFVNSSVNQYRKHQVSQKWRGQLAAILGYKINPTTLLYIKLGMQYNQGVQFNYAMGAIDAVAGVAPADDPVAGVPAIAAVASTSGSVKKNVWTGLVGIGGKMALHSNVFLTAEYTYAMPKEIKFRKNGEEVGKAKVSNHAFRIGLAYKF